MKPPRCNLPLEGGGRCQRRRATLYAAFFGTEPVGVWGWDRDKVAQHVADRAANGEAFHGERVVRVDVDYYNSLLRERGWPAIS